MRSSRRGAAENKRVISGHTHTLHQRLYHALSLGTRFSDNRDKRWQCSDMEIQRHVVRSIVAFLDSISGDTSNQPLVKDSVADIVGALVSVLQCKRANIASLAADAVMKLVGINCSSLQLYVSDLVHPLSSLLSSHELELATLSATALNMILSDLSFKNEKEVFEILKETKAVVNVVSNIKDFHWGTLPIDHFQEMASLLSVILIRWPPSRYSVWSDATLMDVLQTFFLKPDFPAKVVVLKLYSSLALCNYGAKKLIENGESILGMMVHCMGSSEPLSVRIEGFRLAQCLVADEHGCLKMISFCGEPLATAIVNAMKCQGLHMKRVLVSERSTEGKCTNDQMSLLLEACRLALITRWAGKHHSFLWEQQIHNVLLDLLLENFKNRSLEHSLPVEEQIKIAQDGLNSNFLLVLRPYIWEILGCLAVHCEEDFKPNMHGNELCFSILITCACLAFAEAIRKGHQICENNNVDAFRSETASRMVFLMMYSPCKYISSKVRFILAKVLRPLGKEYLDRLVHSLNYIPSGDNFGLANNVNTFIKLVGLACYSGLSEYQNKVAEIDGIKTLFIFMRWCLSNHVHIGRPSSAPHLQNAFRERACCWAPTEEWEGKDTLLLYSLCGLAELVFHSGDINHTEPQLVKILQDVLINISAPGPRCLAAHLLSSFGFYGFPNKIGKAIGKALKETDHADMQFLFTNGASLTVHRVILAVRCPSLLPPKQLPRHENDTDYCSERYDPENPCSMFLREVRLSAHVNEEALLKLLEFVYLGFFEAGEELEKKLKTIAKCCNLQPLIQIFSRKRPKWGTPIPSSDLTPALGPVGHNFSDIILEAEETEVTNWKCNFCSLLVPHVHAHKVILWSSCDYLRAMFQSGMQESHSQTIKVPISWEALMKLVHWFYSYDLPNTPSGCLWDNMSAEERLHELQSYVELYWLAEFWILEDICDTCYRVIVSCLAADRQLSVKIIQIAAGLSLWKLAEVAADYMAPLYNRLRDSGILEEMDEVLIDLVRSASVRLSQERGHSVGEKLSSSGLLT
ncbi:hypothetical protein SLA2020_524800 [Shorea laevis]